jgi:hypothetical protein
MEKLDFGNNAHLHLGMGFPPAFLNERWWLLASNMHLINDH